MFKLDTKIINRKRKDWLIGVDYNEEFQSLQR